MKQVLISIARAVPEMLKHTTVHISLAGWPAAAAIGAIGATVVATAIVLTSTGSAGSIYLAERKEV